MNHAPNAAAGDSRSGVPYRFQRTLTPRSPLLAAAAVLSITLATAAPASALPLPWNGSPVRAAHALAAAEPDSGSPDLLFLPANGDSFGAGEEPIAIVHISRDGDWLRTPFGDNLLTDREAWGDRERRYRTDFELDYNRVDRLRLSTHLEWQTAERMRPRLGGRFGYALDRKRTVYGVQLEQPLLPPGRVAFGVSMVRRTDHPDVQQMDDFENALALLLFRRDFRDYFEREGFGAYLSWRVPDFSTISLHLRSDQYRTLATEWGTRSWLNRDEPLRPNPTVDEGEIHAAILRFERLARRSHRTRAGFTHWLEFERAGGPLEGDFEYTRVLADGRSVLRLSPGTTLSLRGVLGSAWDGAVPIQKQFLVGGVDGLRAHAFGAQRGAQMALAQAEYSLSLWQLQSGGIDAGLQVLAFVDAGRAWSSPDGRYDLDRQPLEADGGFGLATEDDGLRLYFARDLHDADAEFVVSLRLQRPF